MIEQFHYLVKPAAERLLDLCKKAGLEVYWHEVRRTRERQIEIYGHPRFSMHLLGLAGDLYPRIKCKINEWQDHFNSWPNWDLVQRELAVQAGFDPPLPFQLTRDRPHLQCTLGMSENLLVYLWRSSGSGDIEKLEQYIESHAKTKD